MKKLVAYTIFQDPENNPLGERIGVDKETYNSNELGDNPVFKYEEEGSFSENYTLAHEIIPIHYHGSRVDLDYIIRHNLIQSILTERGWNDLNDTERLLIIDLYVYEENAPETEMNDNEWRDHQNNLRVAFLMSSQGITQSEAVSYIQSSFGDHHVAEKKACRVRLDGPHLYKVIAKYLDLDDARNFRDHVRNLFYDFRDEAIFGTEHGSVGIGIIDFIKSTPGTIFETAGLESKGYIMQNGDSDMTNFKSELLCVFLGE
ncbi:MAG: hypothetical protein ACTSPB_04520 [Candidatus Thorarchaeota archaeon]